MPTADELQRRIEAAIPDSSAQVIDLTGGGDHFRAQIISPAFEGMTRIQQHRLVYDVFGDEVVVTYETTTSSGGRGRNTEVVTFDDEDKITRMEVYFGWNLE